MDEKVVIRDAERGDAALLAWTLVSAMGIRWDDMALIESVCADEDTLYSWTRARVLTVNGVPAGALISYPGDEYEALRLPTWKRIWNESPSDAHAYDPETFPGEYYLDSLAVREEYRGRDFGQMLLQDGVRKGHEMGFKEVTLIAETESPALIKYYESAGFRSFSDIKFFGFDYTRMRFISSSQGRR